MNFSDCIISSAVITKTLSADYLSSANVIEGQSLTLICKFENTVNCSWKRKDYVVTINGRYKYTNPNDGKKTKDCSITIERVLQLDNGIWSCGRSLNDIRKEKNVPQIIVLQVTKADVGKAHVLV